MVAWPSIIALTLSIEGKNLSIKIEIAYSMYVVSYDWIIILDWTGAQASKLWRLQHPLSLQSEQGGQPRQLQGEADVDQDHY